MTRWPAKTLDEALQRAKTEIVVMTTDSALDARRLRSALYYRRHRNGAENVTLSLEGPSVTLTPSPLPSLTLSEGESQ